MIWLLDLEIGGRHHRFASEGCEVADANGVAWLYAEGLSEPSLSYGSTFGIGEVSVSVSVDSDDDWALVVAQGHPLVRRPATLRRWTPGTELERARVVLRGLTSGPEWGARGEGITLSIVRSPKAETVTLPDEQAVVSTTTFPTAADEALGKSYPLIIGAPGHTEDAEPVPVVPVPQVLYLDPLQTNEETFTGTYDSLLAPALIPLTYAPRTSRVFRTPFGGAEYELLRNVDWQVSVTPDDETVTLIIATRVELETVDTIRIVYQYILPTDYPGTRSTVAWLGTDAAQVRFMVVPSGEGAGDLITDQPVTTIQDGLGRYLSAVERPFPLPGGDDSGIGSAEDQFYIGFRADGTYGGGVQNRRGELLRGAGDVLEWVLLTQYQGAVDEGRLQSARQRLNVYQIDTWIDTPVNAMDWLRREILPLLPVELREGDRGIWPAIIRHDLTAADCVGHLDATSGAVERSSDVTLTDTEVRNEITVKFRPGRDGGAAGEWLAYRTVSARAGYRTLRTSSWSTLSGASGVTETTVPDPSTIPLPICARSQALYDVRPFTVQAFAVWDAPTASLIATDLANRYAIPRVKVQYTGDVEHLEVGDGVLLTDPEMHWAQVVAVVTDVGPATSDGDATVDLLLL